MPKELTIEITNVCPLNCMHCSTKASPYGTPEHEEIYMSPSEVASYLQEYSDFENVRISGGEPFLHDKLTDILSVIKNEKRKATIMTSGIKFYYKDGYEFPGPLDEKILKEIKPFASDMIFSVHGDFDRHDRIATSIENTDDIQDIAPYNYVWDSINEARNQKIPYSIHTVVMKSNYNELESFVRRVDDLGRATKQKIDVHLMRLVHQGRAVNLPRLTAEEEKAIPVLAEMWNNAYKNVSITYTKAFDNSKCDCGNQKAAIIIKEEKDDKCVWKEVGCSALKEHDNSNGKPFPCLK